MPVIGIPVDLLNHQLNLHLDENTLIRHLQHLGCDVEGYATVQRFQCANCGNIMEITESENPPVLCDQCGADFKAKPDLLTEQGTNSVIRMELLAVRPDMFDPGGLARAMRYYLEQQATPIQYPLRASGYQVTADADFNKAETFRPVIACAVVRNVQFNNDIIRVIMKLQENLHWALGRDRKRASIGTYDLDLLSGTQFHYKLVDKHSLRFMPLGFTAEQAGHPDGLTPQEVLEQHSKGIQYQRHLANFDRYPLLCDEAGQVLSMPPIINSESCRVTLNTHNLFVDVTGTEARIVNKTLNIFITSLAELLPEAQLETVAIDYVGHEPVITPDLTAQSMELDPNLVIRTIGVDLSHGDVEHHLKRMGHGVAIAEQEEQIRVLIPAYRNDILHPIDLAEDVAIAYGYHNITPRLIPTMTVGKADPERDFATHCRRALNGLGYLEVLTLLLSSAEMQYDKLGVPHAEDCVLIENPISVEQTQIRTALLPGLLDTLSANTDHDLPQHLFEVGQVSLLDASAETKAREYLHLAAASIGTRVDYSELRSVCEALLRELGYQLQTVALDKPYFIPGRGAKVIAVQDSKQLELGELGEIHPQVLENFKLVYPVALFELKLHCLLAID